MCFAVEGTPLLFSGDTLFPGGPGNTKFENADFPTIIESIEDRLFSQFGPDTQVLPGHGAGTTIGKESPHLQEWIDRGW
jgi:glyoxylase-like metal-dependent hydrolase (beta-lactamase superfamily II)